MITPIELQYHLESDKSGKPLYMLVNFRGELDESNIDGTATQVYKLIEDTAAGVIFIFDFHELGYMNSKSLGYLSDWFTKITERGGNLKIAAAPANITDILRTVGLDNFISICTTVEEAKAREIITTQKEETNEKGKIIQFPSSANVSKDKAA